MSHTCPRPATEMEQRMYHLGIVGGMGPEATAEIFRRIIAFTAAGRDEEHLSICILNRPQIPSRADYVLRGGESPLAMITECVEDLVRLGVPRFLIPCNTSHVFSAALSGREDIAFIDMVAATKSHVKRRHAGRRACILAARATALLDLYRDRASDGTTDIFYPDREGQAELDRVISAVKAKAEPLGESESAVVRVMARIRRNEGECVFVIACTELSVALAGSAIGGIEYVDALDVLAVTAIAQCGGKLDERAATAGDLRHRRPRLTAGSGETGDTRGGPP